MPIFSPSKGSLGKGESTIGDSPTPVSNPLATELKQCTMNPALNVENASSCAAPKEDFTAPEVAASQSSIMVDGIEILGPTEFPDLDSTIPLAKQTPEEPEQLTTLVEVSTEPCVVILEPSQTVVESAELDRLRKRDQLLSLLEERCAPFLATKFDDSSLSLEDKEWLQSPRTEELMALAQWPVNASPLVIKCKMALLKHMMAQGGLGKSSNGKTMNNVDRTNECIKAILNLDEESVRIASTARYTKARKTPAQIIRKALEAPSEPVATPMTPKARNHAVEVTMPNVPDFTSYKALEERLRSMEAKMDRGWAEVASLKVKLNLDEKRPPPQQARREVILSSNPSTTEHISNVPKIPPLVFTLFVEPRQGDVSPSEIYKIITSNFDKDYQGILDIRTISRGVAIDFDSRESRDFFECDVDSDQATCSILKTSIPRHVFPTVEIGGIPNNMSKGHIIKQLTKAGEALHGFEHEFRDKRRYFKEFKGEITKSVHLSVTPSMYQALVKQNFVVNLGFGKVIIREVFNVRQCQICFDFDHTTSQHTHRHNQNTSTCHKCAGKYQIAENHTCKPGTYKCHNCDIHMKQSTPNRDSLIAHSANTPSCPMYLRKLNALKRCIIYYPEQE